MPIWHKNHQAARNVVHFIGMIVSATSLTAICGYAARKPAFYSWGSPGAMGLPTSVCLCAVGFALFLISRGEAPGDER